MNLDMRQPCGKCGETIGRIETRGGQDCVFCSRCGKYAGYNAPKTETGRAPRTVTSVHNGIKPKQRARVLIRASGRCELCGAKQELHVGHLISVDSGLKMGMTQLQINDDENLSALCAECNLGVSNEPIPLRLAMGMVLSRIEWKSTGGDPDAGSERSGGSFNTEQPNAVDPLEDRGSRREADKGSGADKRLFGEVE